MTKVLTDMPWKGLSGIEVIVGGSGMQAQVFVALPTCVPKSNLVAVFVAVLIVHESVRQESMMNKAIAMKVIVIMYSIVNSVRL